MNIITAPMAPAAIGPYSHAIVQGNLVFTSGQIRISGGPAAQGCPGEN